MTVDAWALRLALTGALVVSCGAVPSLATSSPNTSISTTVERGPSDFTGNFMTDNRPYWMGWLSLTQSGVNVSGSIISVEPDGKGNTKATTNSVTGTTDGGSALSLTTGSFLGTAGVSFSGRRTGDQIALTYPDKTGQLQTATYHASSQATFNNALAAWQAQLATAQAEADRQAAQQKATEQRNSDLAQVVKLDASLLRAWIVNLTSYNSQLGSNIANAKDYLSAEQDTLKTLQDELATLQRDSKEPLTQYQACSSVSYEFNSSMNYTFGNSLAYSRNNFAQIASTLDTQLAAVSGRIQSTQSASKELATAIAASPLVVTGITLPGDEAQTIKTYSATADSVAKQLTDLRATDSSTYAAAQNVMAQAQAIWNTVKTNHHCS